MDYDFFDNVSNNSIKMIKEDTNKLILILEDMIEIILNGDEISSISIRELKARNEEAKIHLNRLRNLLINSKADIPSQYYEQCQKELQVYNEEFMNDVVTTWILNGSKDSVLERLYGACYRIRESVRKINQ